MSKVRKWSCNSCCKSFNQRQSLHRHQKNCSNEDSIVKTFTCENCSKVLTRQDSLKRHSKTCKGEKVVTYCSPCKKSFKTSWHLNRHIAQVHTSQKENRNKIKMKNTIEPEKSQVHTSQKKKTNKEEVTKSIEPEMFIGPEKFIAEEKSIDLSLLVNYFDDSSDSDDFIPSMVGKDADGRPDSDIDMVIESTTEGMWFSSSPLFSKFFTTHSERIEVLSTSVTLPAHSAKYP